MSMIVDRRNVDFLLYEVFDTQSILNAPIYQDYDRDAVTAILDMAQAIAQDKYLPCASEIDANEPEFIGGKAIVPPAAKDALSAYAEAGLFAATFPEGQGGMQLPWHIYAQISNLFTCANTGVHGYAFLTTANANTINTFGSDAQKALYLPAMLEGRWFGTMCLSEPQAGSSLADITTKAEPTENGYYRITGTKMWISGGDQDISENIIHLVLAKIPGGPAGVKGISLFIVPKIRVNSDGALGESNNVALAGLNHKMGHRGTTNTILNFGESGECRGYLIGAPHRGLGYMFHMMNEARIAVGQGAVMSAQAGYLYSLAYACERPQGRLPGEKDPSSPQVPIIQHADVRRMLMTQKAYVEGASALLAYCAQLIDQEKLVTDPAEKKRMALLLDILTPIAKSWPSEFCLEANKLAIQVLGGYGYTREYPVERFYRDNRLNHIHEGTHAIHGIDLLGRKVRMQGGSALNTLLDEIAEAIDAGADNPATATFASDLQHAVVDMIAATQAVLAGDDIQRQLANATIYLDAFGHVVIAWMWLLQANSAVNGLSDGDKADVDFYTGKLKASGFFFRYELPKTKAQFDLVAALDETCLAAKATHFIGV